MATAASPGPTTATSGRIGSGVAALIHGSLLFGLHVWPGWTWVPFLTDELTHVLALITLSLVVSLVADLVYIVARATWVRPLGELVTTGVGLVVLVRMLQVFPFAFDGWSFDWSPLVRIFLVVGIVGSVIGIAVQLVALVRAIGAAPAPLAGGSPGQVG